MNVPERVFERKPVPERRERLFTIDELDLDVFRFFRVSCTLSVATARVTIESVQNWLKVGFSAW